MSDILRVKVGNSWVSIPAIKGEPGTAEIQEDSVSANDLTPELRSELGLEKDVSDRTLDLSSYATAKLAKWQNGTVTYPSSGCNCVEFKFDMTDIIPYIPTGLSHGVNVIGYGMDDDDTYHVKFIVVHGETTYTPNVNTTRTGTWIIPDYEDLDVVYMYVFLKSGSNPAEADIPTFKSDLNAKVYDIVYLGATGVSCHGWITSSDTIVETKSTVFDFGDSSVKVKMIENLNIGDVSPTDSNTIRVLSSGFATTSGCKLANSNAANNTEYIRLTSSWDANLNPRTIDDLTVEIPASANVAFFTILTKYIDSGTTIIDNRHADTHSLSKDDEEHIRSLYPYLGDFCGTFERLINIKKSGWYSDLSDPSKATSDFEYTDILQNGKDGDWYIYHSPSDMKIKNGEVTDGDIIYRKSSTVFLPLENPIKYGNWKTIAQSSYDIVIVGGGAGGIGAAYALRNSGHKVLLVDKMPGLGGTHTQAGLTSLIGSPVGDWFKPLCQAARLQGGMRFKTFVNNYDYSAFGQDTNFDNVWAASSATVPNGGMNVMMWFNRNWLTKRYHDDLTAGGIEIRYQRKFLRHNDVDGTITSLVFQNLNTGAEEKVFAKFVIDCTGDVYVGRYNRTLNTDYYLGTDPYSRFNESAGVNITTGDPYGINTVEILYRYASHHDGAVWSNFYPFPNTDDYADNDDDFPTISGVTSGTNAILAIQMFADPGDATSCPTSNESSYPYVYTTISPDRYCGITKEMYIDNGEEATHEIADRYARAHYKVAKKTASTYYMGSFPLLAIRESYRMKCEYMCTQTDVEDTITSENYAEKQIVALSSWYADIHGTTSVAVGAINNTSKNGIPYLAMVPTSYKNLLIACRGYGASHIALSGMRLIKCMMGLGRAAGFAAKQCVDDGLLDVRDVDVSEVQSDAGVGDLIEYLEDVVYPVLYPEA